MADVLGTSSDALQLPSGGAALSGLGESFTPDLQTGSGNFSVPIVCPEARNGLRPDLTLGYTTGGSNGPFGLGFRIPTMAIQRETARGIPTYDDTSDRFLFTDGGRLVDCGDGRFRPEVDTAHWLIRREGNGWVVVTKDGTRYQLGQSANARVEAGGRVAVWLLQSMTDPNGQEIRYLYREEGPQRYLERVSYGPFEVHVDYSSRPDITTSRRTGFVVETALRAEQIRVLSKRDGTRELRRYELTYITPEPRRLSLLHRIQLVAGSENTRAAMPPVTLEYTPLELSPGPLEVFSTTGDIAPPPLAEGNASLVDLAGDGLPDVISTDAFGTIYWRNIGGGRFAAPERIRPLPGLFGLGDEAVQFLDVEGNGTADLLVGGVAAGYLPNAAGLDWEPFEQYALTLPFDLNDPNLRLTDIDGDGRIDAIFSGTNAFFLFKNLGAEGWDPNPTVVTRRRDLAEWPDVFFSSEAVRFADMTGDGLQDIVLVETGQVSYWPYFGNGNWGERVILGNSPSLPAGFEQERLSLVDMDGNGAADLVYLNAQSVSVWLNQQGRAFGDEQTVDAGVTLPTGGTFLADPRGRGRPGLVVSYTGATPDVTAYRHIPLGGTTAPHLLERIDNGLGSTTEIAYESAEAWRAEDRNSGRDWSSFLPFPLRTLSAITVTDRWSGVSATTRYRYRNGHYDGEERAFRGFAEVEEREEGDGTVPGILRRLRFSVGADLMLSEAERRKLSPAERRLARAEAGLEKSADLFELSLDGTPGPLLESVAQEWEVVTLEAPADDVVLTRRNLAKITTTQDSTGGPARITASRVLGYDAEGDETGREVLGGRDDGTEGIVEELYLKETYDYARSVPDAIGAVRKAVCVRRQEDRGGALLSVRRHYFDGAVFEGLALGQMTSGNLSRSEDYVWDEDSTFEDFPEADLTALGYRQGDLDGKMCWFITSDRLERNAKGVVTRQMGPMGETVDLDFDAFGIHPIRSVNAAGHETLTEIDPQAEAIARVAHPSGHVELRTYDALGRVVAVSRQDDAGSEWLSRVIRYEAEAGDQPARIVNIVPFDPLPLSKLELLQGTPLEALNSAFVQVVYHDGSGSELQRRVSAEPDAAGNSRVLVSGLRHRNQRNFVHREDAPYFATGFDYAPPTVAEIREEFRFAMDWQGRIVRSERVGEVPRVTRYTPWEVTAWDERSMAAGRRTRRTERYDAWGRLIRVEDHDETEGTRYNSYNIDALGRLKEVLDAEGRSVLRMRHDRAGRRLGTWQADSGAQASLLNAGGRAVETVTPMGRLALEYDSINRLKKLLQIEAGGLRLLRRYAYDRDPDGGDVPFLTGRVARIWDESGTLDFDYNRIGQVLKKTRELADGRKMCVKTAYRFTGEMEALTYPNGRRIEMHYNSAGLLDSIPGVIDGIRYRADGRIEERKFANGVTESFRYDALDRMDHFSVAPAGAAPFLEMNYGFGAGMEINRLRHSDGAASSEQRFEFDSFNQLSSRNEDGIAPEAYRYDRCGNILAAGPGGATELRYEQPNAPNRVTSLVDGGNVQQIAYDQAGRITSLRALNRIDYDFFGRLIQAERGDGVRVTFEYGHEYDRVRRILDTNLGTKETLYFDDIFESSDGVELCHIVTGGALIGSIVVQDDGSEDLRLHHTDHLGSTRLITDAAAQPILAPRHGPFGQPEAGAQDPGLFIGRDYDPDLGLVYLQMRWYDPSLRRFLTPDPTVLDTPQTFVFMPGGFNPYAYAVNNPIRYRDPNGRFAILAAVIVGAVVGGFLGYQAAKEQGKNPWTGALIGALVGGVLGYAGGFGALAAAGKGALLSAASTTGIALIKGEEVENFWTSVAIGFAFGGLGHFVGTWTPVSGSGVWVNTANIAKEIAIDAAMGGLRGLAFAAITDGDLSKGFFDGALMGAAFSAANIVVMGVRYDPLSGKSGNSPIESQVRVEYQMQSAGDNSHLASDIRAEHFPELSHVQFRRHGLLPKIITSTFPDRGGSIVLGNNVVLAKGEHYNIRTLAHELRHIHQQQLLTFGTAEFLIRYLFLQDHSKHYTPGNTTYEPHY